MRRLLLVLLWPVLATADVRMTRTPCYGSCPADFVELAAGGSHYSGFRHIPEIGDYDGRISATELAVLERLIHNAGFDDLPPRLGVPNPDVPTITVTVGTKTVVDVSGRAPELAPIKELVEETMQSVRWEPVSSGLRGAIAYPFVVDGPGGAKYAVRGDANGSYILPLRPGTYTVLGRDVVVHEREWVTVDAPLTVR